MKLLHASLKYVSHMLTYISATAGTFMCVFIILSSTMRYVVGSPFRFTEELVGLLFSAMVFVLLPVGEIENRHIRVTVVTDLYSPFWRRFSELLSSVAVIVFAIVFSLISFDFTAMSYELGASSEMSAMLLYPWMALMPLSSALLGIAVVIRRLEDMKNGDTHKGSSESL